MIGPPADLATPAEFMLPAGREVIHILLDKPDHRQVQAPVDWIGLPVPDRFVAGYGLDDDGRFRNLLCGAAVMTDGPAR